MFAIISNRKPQETIFLDFRETFIIVKIPHEINVQRLQLIVIFISKNKSIRQLS